MTAGTFSVPLPENADELRVQEEAYADLADAIRPLIDACVRTRVAPEKAHEVASRARELTAELMSTAQDGPLGLEVTSDGRIRDHGNPAVGMRNPIALPLVFERAEDRRSLRADLELGAAYEGPPGHAHGGVIALLLDQALGTLPAMIGLPALTAYLNLTYKAPSPLGRFVLEAEVADVSGWKILCRGRLRDREGTVTAEAEGLFIVPRWARDRLGTPTGDAGDFDTKPHG
ncbi:PaaI family thioesterase [uncultured Arsenicicoccus sp.]|uniref:PaaI family thioesterase n=1 Tax=uncultured Arsenicicoccus sp. TaxID=491339 RepID=UPI0025967D98|nr:PaaI family thioesterase [uncultured Arsenicicoccus sp.]